ncbi:MAG: hypothetical protein KAV87_55210, partial [Desulfobacteraceae bacterium]|nr:hypothetical protein [Desulfobacteraceae bacterium]
GRWQSPKTSDINRQAKLIDLNPGEFNRGKLRLNSSINSGDLTITIEYYGKIYADFDLYNTHSLPVGRSQEPHYPEPRTEMTRSVGKLYVNLLDVRYYVPPHGTVGAWSRMDKVLHSVPHWELWEVVEPRHHVQNVFETPFFFQDRRHVFFVQPLRTLVPIDQHLGFGLVVIYPGPKEPVIPPLVVIPDYKMRGPGLFPFPEDRMQPVPIAPGPLEVFLERDIYIRHAVQTGGAILYKGKLIGPRGSL